MTTWVKTDGIHIPSKPYTIQSGKRQGKTLELLMFNDYGFLNWWKKELDKKAIYGNLNRAHKHLTWLIAQGETRKPKMICRFCELRPVTQFSVRYSSWGGQSSFSAGYSCCDNLECMGKLEGYAHKNVTFMSFKFSNILKFPIKADQELVVRMFRQIFELPEKLTRDAAFKFFAE